MKERGKQDNALLCLIVAEIIYLMINVISLARSGATSLIFLTGDMDFIYGDREAVTALEDGSFEISDGESGDAWVIWQISLPAGQYRLTMYYQLERNREWEGICRAVK